MTHHRLAPGRNSLVGRIALEGRMVHIPDVLADPEYKQREAQKLGRWRTMLGVPLMREDTAIGALTLTRSEVRPFNDKQIELLTTFADQAVIAIENVRLFDEVQARTRDLSESLEQQTATSEVLSVISSSPGELEPVFNAMLDNATRICGAEFGNLYQFEEGSFRIVAAHSPSPGIATERLREAPLRPSPGTGLGRVMRTKNAVQIPDVLADPEYPHDDPLRIVAEREGVRTLLAVPLMKDNDLLGAITIYRQEVRPFTDKQVELVSNFAKQAVIAIENVRLLNELRARTIELARSVEELRALGEVSQAVNSTVDLETVLTTIVAKATQLSGTEAGAIYEFDDANQEFQLRSTYGMNDAIVAEIRDRHIHIGETTIGEAVERREPVQIPDLRSDPSTPARDIVRGWFPSVAGRTAARRQPDRRRACGSPQSSPARFRRTRSICSKHSPPSRCWRSRTRTCSPRSTRRAGSSRSQASTSRNSWPT